MEINTVEENIKSVNRIEVNIFVYVLMSETNTFHKCPFISIEIETLNQNPVCSNFEYTYMFYYLITITDEGNLIK